MSFRDAENTLVADALDEKLAELGFTHIEAHPEPVGSIDFMPRIDGERVFARNRIPEVTVFWVINKVPGAVEEIQDLSQWFSNVSPRLPIAQISLSTDSISNPGYDRQQGVELPPPSVIHQDDPLPLEYHVIEADESLAEDLEIPDGLEVLFVDDFSRSWIQNTLADLLAADLNDLTDEDVIDFFSISYYVEAWEDVVFHFNEVLRAYRQNQIGFLIVLLSVYFESDIEKELTQFVEQIRQNEHARNFVKDMTFEEKLVACRYFEVLGETEYNVINKVRISRNNYAHDIGAFRDTEVTILEEEDLVNDAIEIYEESIGLEQSVLDE
jgi:hypothetical protein